MASDDGQQNEVKNTQLGLSLHLYFLGSILVIFEIIGLAEKNLYILNPHFTTINNMFVNFLYDRYFLSKMDSEMSIKKKAK